jgi:endonuclease/exonuclease/phosphatase family metal-dependent hydrolase
MNTKLITNCLFFKKIYVGFFLLILFSSCEGEKKEISNPYDPSKPVILESFKPLQGGVREKVILKGENFGVDPENIKVYFNNAKASVISSSGDNIYVLVPRMPGESNFGSLKVSSYNIRHASSADIETGNGWDVRKQHVANLIGTHNFDIVGTQEGNDAQLADLKGYLPEYNFVGHPYGGSNNNTHNNAIFYKKEKYEVIDKGVFWFSETPDIPSIGWDASDQRICYWAKFKELETNLEFYFFNVHFYWRNHTAKLNSGPLLAAKVQEIAGDAPAISTGDFNSLSTSPQINAILTVLKDAYDITETPPVGPVDTNLGGGVFSGEPNGRIDYIFVSDHFKVKNYAVLADTYNDGRYPSDHLPVSAELSIKLD